MIKQKGLVFKTFVFTFTLITLVITVSFGILYFMLPGYYLREKSKNLEKNADTLAISLSKAESEDACAALISDFAVSNNSNVISFDSEDLFIPELSSPLLLMNGSEGEYINFRYVENREEDAGQDKKIFITSMIINRENPDEPMEDWKKVGLTDSDGKAFFIQREKSNAFITKYLRNDLINYITISSTLQPIDEAKNVVVSLIPYLLILDFIIALIAAYIFANQLTKPILQISNAAAMMQKMKQNVLSNVRTNDELGQLSHNLDNLYLNLCENIENLKIEMDKVSKMEQSKTDFMRAAGHELKTPIAALNGIIEGMIDNIGVYKNHEKYLNECKEQVTKLAKLVNEILMSSQFEHIEKNIVFEDINVNDIVEEAVSMYRVLIEKNGIQIEQELFDFVYRTDGHILLNTLSNLISNAVNYTVSGGKIIVSFVTSENRSVLSIENQCKHIDDELLPKLFEPFVTLNYSRNKSESGTGLGLYIVKKNLEILKLPFKFENTEIGLKISIIFEKPLE